MDPIELRNKFEKAREVIADLFEETWLRSSTGNELQTLWKRADWIANTELLIFGDCLEKCRQIDEDRAKYFVKKIKSSNDHNERKGAIYEIFIAGAFYNEGSSAVSFPANPESPDYDLKLIQDELNIYLSVKNYGLFKRVDDFAVRSKQIKEQIKQNIKNGCNTVFIINDKSFPDVLEWRSLREILPQLINSDSKKTTDGEWLISVDGGWSAAVKYATGDEPDAMRNTSIPGPICPSKASYILSIYTKLHENDFKTLFEKVFDKACENFEKIGKNDEKSINIVFLMVPREIDLESCKQRSIDYFSIKENSKVAGIFFHQPELVQQGIAHCYALIMNPNKKNAMEKTKLIPKFVAGVWKNGSAPIMFVTGKNNIISTDTEYVKYQSGQIFYRPIGNKYSSKIINGVLMEPCESSIGIGGKNIRRRMSLPESDDLLLL
jgi:hypothetical protein